MPHDAPPTRPRVLMITPRFVHPADRGDRIRTWHTLCELSRHADVSLACLADEPIRASSWEAVYERVERLAIEPAPSGGAARGLAKGLATGRSVSEFAFDSPALRRTIGEWTEDGGFDAALAVCSSTASYLEGLPIACRMVDLVDVDSRKWADYAEQARGPRRWVYRREARKVAALEAAIADRYDVAITCDREAKLLRRVAPKANVTVVRNGVELPGPLHPAGRSAPVATFTGMLNYRPNVEGLRWFCEQVWPAVHAAVPDAEFHIVGRNAARAVQRLGARAGVRLVGPVAEVEPRLAAARVAVAPLHIARGVQNKALQAMAAGRPVVTTPAVQAGLAVNGRCPAIVPADIRAWSATLIELLTAAPLATAFGTRGRLFADQHYRWSETIAPLLRRLLPQQLAEHRVILTRARAAA